MEQELGYQLIKRQKGHRIVQLTDQGTEFYHIAWKWQQLLEETNSIPIFSKSESLTVAAVYSVSQHFLSRILPDFLKDGFRLRLYNVFSEDAYQYMAQGLYDLAFIAQQNFTSKIPPGVHSKPAFSEAFVVAAYAELPNNDHVIDIRGLDPAKEIYAAWETTFKSWHANNFNEQIAPLIYLDDVSMIDYFLVEDNWVFVPYMTGECLRRRGANIYHISNGPPDRIVYYLTRENAKVKSIELLLSLLDQLLQTMPQNEIHSFLPHTRT